MINLHNNGKKQDIVNQLAQAFITKFQVKIYKTHEVTLDSSCTCVEKKQAYHMYHSCFMYCTVRRRIVKSRFLQNSRDLEINTRKMEAMFRGKKHNHKRKQQDARNIGVKCQKCHFSQGAIEQLFQLETSG